MAIRRMFSAKIVEDDVFLDMPGTSQNLYFHLCMNADDDGFVSPKKVMRMCGAAQDDLSILILKRYILIFPSGVAVVKAWPIMNKVQKDRYITTTYQKEFRQLTYNEFGAYTEKRAAQTSLLESVNSNTTENSSQEQEKDANVNKMDTQYRLGKVSIVKINTTTNVVAAKKPRSEIGSLYYKVIKAYDLPVTNHNVIQAKIRQWEKESDQETAINYLNFLLSQYKDLKFNYKPEISTALDIYSKRAMIRERIQSEINKSKRRKIREI